MLLLRPGVVGVGRELLLAAGGVGGQRVDQVERLGDAEAAVHDAAEPILILIPSVEALSRYSEGVPESARKLADAFWPGGLTLVCSAKETVSPLLTAGTGKIGVRLSGNFIATALCRAVGGAITSTSANRSGSPPCTSAAQVLKAFPSGLDMVIDGGSCASEAGSTVVDVTETPCRILRQGVIPREALEALVPIR